MANNNISLAEFFSNLLKSPEGDFLKQSMRTLVQGIMECEVEAQIGASRHERTDERQTYRNGYRERKWDTRLGTLDLKIPKLRHGSYFPSLLNPRRRAERALVSVIQEAYVLGVSTRKVDDLAQVLGLEGIDKSQVSRLCKELDAEVEQFRNRPLTDRTYPYLWLDATYVKVREDGHVRSMAVVIAVATNDLGGREVLGFNVGLSEDYTFWLEFFRSLLARGLSGVQLVISDAHQGLKSALHQAFGGATWQRCRVHFMRNVLSQVPKTAQPVVSAAVKQIFSEADVKRSATLVQSTAEQLQNRFPKVADKLLNECLESLAYLEFPSEHHKQIHSTNPLERLNREIKRRTDVVGIFPNRASALRLVGMLLLEQNDEWLISRRTYSQESMNKILPPATHEPQQPALAG